MPIESGTILLHYALTEKLGEGGMGAVWRALKEPTGGPGRPRVSRDRRPARRAVRGPRPARVAPRQRVAAAVHRQVP